MPYSSVDELPANVKSKLGSPKKRRQWMHAWNSSFDAHHDESRAFASAWAAVRKVAKVTTMDDNLNFFLPITKIDREQRLVSGYASTACLDSDGEIVSQEAIKAALPDYMKWANIREMHKPSAVGRTQEANLDPRGLYITAKIVDDAAWKKVCDRVYNGFSIGGRKLAKVGNTITKLGLTEISVVDRPANPEAVFDCWKSAGPIEDAPAVLVVASETDLSKAETIVDEEFLAKKAAKRLAKLEKRVKKGSVSKSSPAARDTEGGAEAALGKAESRHELVLEKKIEGAVDGLVARGLTLQGEDITSLELATGRKISKIRKGKKMSETGDNNAVGKMLIQLLSQSGVAKQHTAALLLKAADDEMKSMKEHRKDAEDCVKMLFNMHKGAITKAEGGGSFDHTGAVKLLQKLYADIGMMKSIAKSARSNIEKAAGRVSAPGTVEDPLAGVYRPDPGGDLQLISPGTMDNLPAHKGEGMVSQAQVDALLKAARLEAENEILKRMPAAPSGGRRPASFDMNKLGGSSDGSDNPLLKGINPSDLQSENESTRETAVAKMIGNMLLGSRGKPVLSPEFHGTFGVGNTQH